MIIKKMERSRYNKNIVDLIVDQLFPWLNYGPQAIDVINIMLHDIFPGRSDIQLILREEFKRWKPNG